MKIENIKTGMFVKDKFGNEYKVLRVGHNVVYLICKKFVRFVRVNSQFAFQKAGDEFWIITSEEDAKELFGYCVDISVKSIEPIKILMRKF